MIRLQALALIRRGDEILVELGHDEVKSETFYRLLGGTVEFREPAAETLHREFLEELGTELDVGPLIATIENIFTYAGEPKHEFCLVYECALRDESFYGRDSWDAEEQTPGGIVIHPVSWRSVASFSADGAILYPEELLGLKQLQ